MFKTTNSNLKKSVATVFLLGCFVLRGFAQDQNFPSVVDYGAIGDGVTDNLPAFNAAIAALVQQGPSVYPTQGKLVVPPGTYKLNGTLVLSNSIHLIGHSAGQSGGNSLSVLKFPANTTGIRVLRGSTSPAQNGADGTILEGIYLSGGMGSNATAHGVDVQARVKIRDCSIFGFKGNGINIVADEITGAENANWSIDSVLLIVNGGHGLYVAGTGASSGTAYGVSTVANVGWGIYDSSLWGNNYFGAHSASNEQGAYKSEGTDNRSLFLGCYSEGGQPPSEIALPSIGAGGLHGAGGTGNSFYINNGIPSMAAVNATETAMIDIRKEGSDQLLTLTDTDHPDQPFRLKYTPGKWFLQLGETSGSEIIQLLNRQATPANGFVRDLSTKSGAVSLPNGYYVLNMRFRGEAATAPTSGSWLRGDLLYNLAPVAGGYVGWQCVATGSPGTWKGFGAIDP